MPASPFLGGEGRLFFGDVAKVFRKTIEQNNMDAKEALCRAAHNKQLFPKNVYIVKKVKTGKVIVVGSLKEAGELFLEWLKLRNYSSENISAYCNGIHSFISFSAENNIVMLRNVTKNHLVNYRLYLVASELPKHTINAYISSVILLFQFAEAFGLIISNPTKALNTPKIYQQTKGIPTIAEVTLFINAIDISGTVSVRNSALR
jgi:Phage integrase, N-terminal SAM-like domain